MHGPWRQHYIIALLHETPLQAIGLDPKREKAVLHDKGLMLALVVVHARGNGLGVHEQLATIEPVLDDFFVAPALLDPQLSFLPAACLVSISSS